MPAFIQVCVVNTEHTEQSIKIQMLNNTSGV